MSYDSDEEVNGDSSDEEEMQSEEEEEEEESSSAQKGDWATSSTISMVKRNRKPLPVTESIESHLQDFEKYAKAIVDRTNCLQDYKLIGFLGSGSAGFLCRVRHRKTKKEFALKLESLEDRKHEEGWKTETDIMEKFSECGLGIKYIDRCVTKLGKVRRGVILMEMVDGVLYDFLHQMKRVNKSILDNISNQIIHILKEMKRHNLSHRDLWFFNIGYNINPKTNKIELKLIDFDKGSKERNFWDLEICNIGCNLFETEDEETIPPITYLAKTLWPRLIKMFHSPYLKANPPMDYESISKAANRLYNTSYKTRLIPQPKKRELCGFISQRTNKPCANFKDGCRWHRK
jgi:serine/threonine protein kinase